MSVKTIEKVKEIERQAEALERDYDQQLINLKKATATQTEQMQETLVSELTTFKEQEQEKLKMKLHTLKETNQQGLAEQLSQLEKSFEHKKKELVQAVVKEVMRKYGNS